MQDYENLASDVSFAPFAFAVINFSASLFFPPFSLVCCVWSVLIAAAAGENKMSKAGTRICKVLNVNQGLEGMMEEYEDLSSDVSIYN